MKTPSRYWLMKSEPHEFSIQDLSKSVVTQWDGIRNYQARNFLRDEVQPGDAVLFYHSNTPDNGVAGLARVIRGAYPDDRAHDPGDPLFDPKSSPQKPRWFQVDLEFVKRFRGVLPLSLIRKTPGLKDMVLLRNPRLSVQPVRKKEWDIILRLAEDLETKK
ncbi:MAG TPA: EVE domain-containing protein [Nitrospiria bacterium]|nr:EVE domain-containing protein [Nitrospiria bacterium]